MKLAESRLRKSHRRFALFIICVTAAALMFTGVLVVKAAVRRNKEAALRTRCFQTITVKPGESLWSIAEEYAEEGCSIKAYISELKEMNNISSDRIYAGQRLLVTYYTDNVNVVERE